MTVPFGRAARVAERRPSGKIRGVAADSEDTLLRDCPHHLNVGLVFGGQQTLGGHR